MAKDMCRLEGWKTICDGNKGVLRCDMPQIPLTPTDTGYEALAQAMSDRQIQRQRHTVRLESLTPTQGQINYDKVIGIVDAVKTGKWRPSFEGDEGPWSGSVITTEDGFVLDGHHRTAATKILFTHESAADWRKRFFHDKPLPDITVDQYTDMAPGSETRANITNILAITNQVEDVRHTKCPAFDPTYYRG